MQDVQQKISQNEEHDDAPDKLFGVCQAVGEDLGFNPFYLRVALIVMLVFSPIAVVATYVSLAAVVLLSRILFPNPVAAPASEQIVNVEAVSEELPLAA